MSAVDDGDVGGLAGFERTDLVEVDLDGQIFRLEPSDSISYDTRQPHRLRAATEEKVKLLMIEASPGFSNVRLR